VLCRAQQPRQLPLLDQVQKIFDKARMSEEGAEHIKAARKEAADLMNTGVLLWKTGKLDEAVEWMRVARKPCPQYAHPVQFSADPDLAFAAEWLRCGTGR
jgi:hypothetical protein